MKRKLKVICAVSVVVGIVMVFVLVGGFYYALRQENLNLTKGNLVYLQETIAAYKQDAEKAGKTNVYPETLKALVDENYLANADLRELTDGAVVEYFKPTNANDPSAFILKATVGRDVFLCPLSGPVQFQK
jgi:hypothetical protein